MTTTKNARILGLCLLASFVAVAPRTFSADPVINIEWSSKNKDQARRIHDLTSRIYSGDLNPDQMINDLTKLTNLLTDSSFSRLPGMDEFQVVAHAIYAWRTTNVEKQKGEQSERRKSDETEMSGATAVLGPLVDVEAKYRHLINELKSNSTSELTKIQSDGHKIEDLRAAWHQSYRLLLTSLTKHGFSLPVDEGDVVGTWTWRSSDAVITFTFKKDHTMQAKIKPDNPKDWPGGGWVNEGKGEWKVDYNRLDVQMDKVWVGVFWKDHRVTWFDDTVKSISKDTIVLNREDHNELKRASVR